MSTTANTYPKVQIGFQDPVTGFWTPINSVSGLPVATVGALPSTPANILKDETFTVVNAFAGASVGDVLVRRELIDGTTFASISVTWINVTTNGTLGFTPASADIVYSAGGTAPLTDSQLRAAPVVTNDPTVVAKVEQLRSDLLTVLMGDPTLLGSLTDNVIALLQSSNSYIDQVETLLTLLNSNTDGLEALLTAVGLNTDGLETLLVEIRDRLPFAIGQQLSPQSLSVVLASDATLPLPTGAATSVDIAALLAEVQALRLQVPALLGPQTAANSLSVVVANPSSSGVATVVDTYIANTNAANYVIGDVIRRLEVIDTTTNTSSVSWSNLTQGTTGFAAPPFAHLTVTASSALTNAELRAAPVDVLGPLTDAELRATPVDVLGPVTDAELRATPLPVLGPLTDVELRATPVDVLGPLTNTELRATPVDVLGPLTNTELRGTPVDVLGPLTDTQLRAAPVPVLGPATDAELRATPLPVTGPLTDVELRATPVNVAGPLTDVQLRATPVDVLGPLTDLQLRASEVAVVDNDVATNTFNLNTEVQNRLPLSTTRTTALINVNNSSGTIATGAQEVSFANTGASTCLVSGGVLPVGYVVTYKAADQDTLGPIVYDATGSALLISEIR
jgi:hypothetical protein